MSGTVQKLVQTLIRSLGLKRKLSNLFQVLSVVVLTTPVLKDYASILQAIASWLGVVGVTHAVVDKSKLVNVSTVAAFFSALALAAKSVPALEPYVVLIQAIATLLSMFSTTSLKTTKPK